jgi:hypothetical protein
VPMSGRCVDQTCTVLRREPMKRCFRGPGPQTPGSHCADQARGQRRLPDRADAARALANFAEATESRESLLRLVLDGGDTFVTRATAEELLRRQDTAGFTIVAEALVSADLQHRTYIHDAVTAVSWCSPRSGTVRWKPAMRCRSTPVHKYVREPRNWARCSLRSIRSSTRDQCGHGESSVGNLPAAAPNPGLSEAGRGRSVRAAVRGHQVAWRLQVGCDHRPSAARTLRRDRTP